MDSVRGDGKDRLRTPRKLSVSMLPCSVGLKNTSIFFFLTSCCAEGNEDAAACWPPPAIGCCPLDSSSGGPFVEVALEVNS